MRYKRIAQCRGPRWLHRQGSRISGQIHGQDSMGQKGDTSTKTDTFTKLKEREREIRRNIILDAAEKVLATTPYGEVNMRRIAKEAGISPASIYTYFPDQETLFVESYVRGTGELLDIIERIAAQGESRLEKIVEAYIDHYTSHNFYFRMLAHFMLSAKLRPDSLEKLNARGRILLDHFDVAFRELNLTDNVRFISHTFFAALNGILISFIKFPNRSEEEVIRHMKCLGALLVKTFRTASARNSADP
jgi:AcrR family transcriptional regulator